MNLDALAEHPEAGLRLEEITSFLDGAADPESVAVGLQRLLEAGANPLEHLDGWMRLLDASPASVEPLLAYPSLVTEIPRERGAYERDQLARDLADALADLPSLEERVDHLRRVRVVELLRVAWQDIVEGADLTVVTRRISDLADLVMGLLLSEVQQELTRTYGRPWSGSEPVRAAILAMGKLGGAELNYASDIDLIFVYGKDGETDGGAGGERISNREYFHRLTERVTREANAIAPAGRLYRVDLRLRPEGQTGSLALSLAATLAYYRRLGETWERQALLKARVIAGDRALGEEFVQSVRSWVYGRGLSFEEIGSIKRIKSRIEERAQQRGEERTEVKLGYGGIRDVEYVIQFLQLLHGARNPEVRHHNSLTALRLLEAAGVILPAERDVLDDAYRFLRGVEHRLQLVQWAQVHRIPDHPRELATLARRCGYADAPAFAAAYREKAEAVRGIFNRLFRGVFGERDAEQVRETDLLLSDAPDPVALHEVLAAHGIRDGAAAARTVALLAQETSSWLAGSPRTRKSLADLFPQLLDAIAAMPDPDTALDRFERVTARVGARGTLYEALASHAPLLRLLVDLTGHSLFLSNILERAPGALDQLVDAVATDAGRGLKSFEDIPTLLVPTSPDPSRILSDYKNLEMLRIGLRDIRGEQGVREVGEDLARLAEVIVRLAYERSRRDARATGGDFVVIALGKLGAREMLYGSDLDLVFFARSPEHRDGAAAVARRMHALLGAPTDYGKLYEVDLRLRPDGASGPLTTSVGEFREYFARGLGQTWERMAYSRARAVAGPPSLCEEVEREIAETVYAPGFTAEDAAAMRAMRERLAAKGGPDSIKRARAGGVVDVEFVAQMHALRQGARDPRFRDGNVGRLLDLVRREGLVEGRRAADLETAYRFLLVLESRLRIVADLPEDRLPEDAAALRVLARRLGYVDTGTCTAEASLQEEYAYHRDIAARAFRDAFA